MNSLNWVPNASEYWLADQTLPTLEEEISARVEEESSPEQIKSTADIVMEKIKVIVSHDAVCGALLSDLFPRSRSTDLSTSCSANAKLLNTFFVGYDRTEWVAKGLRYSICVKNDIEVPESHSDSEVDIPKNLKSKSVYFHNVLSGNVVLDVNRSQKSLSFEAANLMGKDSEKKFPEYHKSLQLFKKHLADRYAAGKIDDDIYNYNHNIIDSLEEEEVKSNRDKVSEDCSFIYHVAITDAAYATQETISDLSRLKLDPVTNIVTMCWHAFNLEQYYDKEMDADKLRLHHSWVGEFSLEDYYNDRFIKSLDISEFCKNFKGLFSSLAFEKIRECKKACFNVDNTVDSSASYMEDIGLFTGRSVRYVTSKINPNDSLKNVNEILKIYDLI